MAARLLKYEDFMLETVTKKELVSVLFGIYCSFRSSSTEKRSLIKNE